MSGLGWTPTEGDTVHLNIRNKWQVPAGRYKVRAGFDGKWHLHGLTNDTVTAAISGTHLIGAEANATLTAIPRDELEREAHRIALKLHAPMRGSARRQHDASDLALFRAMNEERML